MTFLGMTRRTALASGAVSLILRAGAKVALFVGTGRAVDVLSDRLMTAWLNFARTGNPSQEGLEWPAYGTEHRETMIFDAPSRVAYAPDRKTLEFWSK